MSNKEEITDKVHITPEAKLDYKLISGKVLPTLYMREQVEENLYYRRITQRLQVCRYFRVKYYDEHLNEMLILFFYKGKKISTMQNWDLAGICLESDWSEEQEDNGMIRSWLKTELNPKGDEDWVEVMNKLTKEFEEIMEEER